MFIDRVVVRVKAGNGGSGMVSFRREKFVPNGGPDGGDGGTGGDVILRADRGVNTLFAFKRRRYFNAEAGQAGGPNRMRGKSGEDLEVLVPVGTVVRDADSGEILGDLTRESQVALSNLCPSVLLWIG